MSVFGLGGWALDAGWFGLADASELAYVPILSLWWAKEDIFMPSKREARTGEAVADWVVLGVVVAGVGKGEGFSRDMGRGVTLFSLRLDGREPCWLLLLLMWFSMYRFVGW